MSFPITFPQESNTPTTTIKPPSHLPQPSLTYTTSPQIWSSTLSHLEKQHEFIQDCDYIGFEGEEVATTPSLYRPEIFTSSSSLLNIFSLLIHTTSTLGDLTCRICVDLLDNPMTLPCCHSFCSLCLKALIENNPQKSKSSYLKCPLCKSDFNLRSCIEDKQLLVVVAVIRNLHSLLVQGYEYMATKETQERKKLIQIINSVHESALKHAYILDPCTGTNGTDNISNISGKNMIIDGLSSNDPFLPYTKTILQHYPFLTKNNHGIPHPTGLQTHPMALFDGVNVDNDQSSRDLLALIHQVPVGDLFPDQTDYPNTIIHKNTSRSSGRNNAPTLETNPIMRDNITHSSSHKAASSKPTPTSVQLTNYILFFHSQIAKLNLTKQQLHHITYTPLLRIRTSLRQFLYPPTQYYQLALRQRSISLDIITKSLLFQLPSFLTYHLFQKLTNAAIEKQQQLVEVIAGTMPMVSSSTQLSTTKPQSHLLDNNKSHNSVLQSDDKHGNESSDLIGEIQSNIVLIASEIPKIPSEIVLNNINASRRTTTRKNNPNSKSNEKQQQQMVSVFGPNLEQSQGRIDHIALINNAVNNPTENAMLGMFTGLTQLTTASFKNTNKNKQRTSITHDNNFSTSNNHKDHPDASFNSSHQNKNKTNVFVSPQSYQQGESERSMNNNQMISLETYWSDTIINLHPSLISSNTSTFPNKNNQLHSTPNSTSNNDTNNNIITANNNESFIPNTFRTQFTIDNISVYPAPTTRSVSPSIPWHIAFILTSLVDRSYDPNQRIPMSFEQYISAVQLNEKRQTIRNEGFLIETETRFEGLKDFQLQMDAEYESDMMELNILEKVYKEKKHKMEILEKKRSFLLQFPRTTIGKLLFSGVIDQTNVDDIINNDGNWANANNNTNNNNNSNNNHKKNKNDLKNKSNDQPTIYNYGGFFTNTLSKPSQLAIRTLDHFLQDGYYDDHDSDSEGCDDDDDDEYDYDENGNYQRVNKNKGYFSNPYDPYPFVAELTHYYQPSETKLIVDGDNHDEFIHISNTPKQQQEQQGIIHNPSPLIMTAQSKPNQLSSYHNSNNGPLSIDQAYEKLVETLSDRPLVRHSLEIHSTIDLLAIINAIVNSPETNQSYENVIEKVLKRYSQRTKDAIQGSKNQTTKRIRKSTKLIDDNELKMGDTRTKLLARPCTLSDDDESDCVSLTSDHNLSNDNSFLIDNQNNDEYIGVIEQHTNLLQGPPSGLLDDEINSYFYSMTNSVGDIDHYDHINFEGSDAQSTMWEEGNESVVGSHDGGPFHHGNNTDIEYDHHHDDNDETMPFYQNDVVVGDQKIESITKVMLSDCDDDDDDVDGDKLLNLTLTNFRSHQIAKDAEEQRIRDENERLLSHRKAMGLNIDGGEMTNGANQNSSQKKKKMRLRPVDDFSKLLTTRKKTSLKKTTSRLHDDDVDYDGGDDDEDGEVKHGWAKYSFDDFFTQIQPIFNTISHNLSVTPISFDFYGRIVPFPVLMELYQDYFPIVLEGENYSHHEKAQGGNQKNQTKDYQSALPSTPRSTNPTYGPGGTTSTMIYTPTSNTANNNDQNSKAHHLSFGQSLIAQRSALYPNPLQIVATPNTAMGVNNNNHNINTSLTSFHSLSSHHRPSVLLSPYSTKTQMSMLGHNGSSGGNSFRSAGGSIQNFINNHTSHNNTSKHFNDNSNNNSNRHLNNFIYSVQNSNTPNTSGRNNWLQHENQGNLPFHNNRGLNTSFNRNIPNLNTTLLPPHLLPNDMSNRTIPLLPHPSSNPSLYPSQSHLILKTSSLDHSNPHHHHTNPEVINALLDNCILTQELIETFTTLQNNNEQPITTPLMFRWRDSIPSHHQTINPSYWDQHSLSKRKRNNRLSKDKCNNHNNHHRGVYQDLLEDFSSYNSTQQTHVNTMITSSDNDLYNDEIQSMNGHYHDHHDDDGEDEPNNSSTFISPSTHINKMGFDPHLTDPFDSDGYDNDDDKFADAYEFANKLTMVGDNSDHHRNTTHQHIVQQPTSPIPLKKPYIPHNNKEIKPSCIIQFVNPFAVLFGLQQQSFNQIIPFTENLKSLIGQLKATPTESSSVKIMNEANSISVESMEDDDDDDDHYFKGKVNHDEDKPFENEDCAHLIKIIPHISTLSSPFSSIIYNRSLEDKKSIHQLGSLHTNIKDLHNTPQTKKSPLPAYLLALLLESTHPGFIDKTSRHIIGCNTGISMFPSLNYQQKDDNEQKTQKKTDNKKSPKRNSSTTPHPASTLVHKDNISEYSKLSGLRGTIHIAGQKNNIMTEMINFVFSHSISLKLNDILPSLCSTLNEHLYLSLPLSNYFNEKRAMGLSIIDSNNYQYNLTHQNNNIHSITNQMIPLHSKFLHDDPFNTTLNDSTIFNTSVFNTSMFNTTDGSIECYDELNHSTTSIRSATKKQTTKSKSKAKSGTKSSKSFKPPTSDSLPSPPIDDLLTNTTVSSLTGGMWTVLSESIPIPSSYYTNCHCCQLPGHTKWWWFEESHYIYDLVTQSSKNINNDDNKALFVEHVTSADDSVGLYRLNYQQQMMVLSGNGCNEICEPNNYNLLSKLLKQWLSSTPSLAKDLNDLRQLASVVMANKNNDTMSLRESTQAPNPQRNSSSHSSHKSHPTIIIPSQTSQQLSSHQSVVCHELITGFHPESITLPNHYLLRCSSCDVTAHKRCYGSGGRWVRVSGYSGVHNDETPSNSSQSHQHTPSESIELVSHIRGWQWQCMYCYLRNSMLFYNLFHVKLGSVERMINLSILQPLPHTRKVIWEMTISKEHVIDGTISDDIIDDPNHPGSFMKPLVDSSKPPHSTLETVTSLDLTLPASFLLSFPSVCTLCPHTLSLAIKPIVYDEDYFDASQADPYKKKPALNNESNVSFNRQNINEFNSPTTESGFGMENQDVFSNDSKESGSLFNSIIPPHLLKEQGKDPSTTARINSHYPYLPSHPHNYIDFSEIPINAESSSDDEDAMGDFYDGCGESVGRFIMMAYRTAHHNITSLSQKFTSHYPIVDTSILNLGDGSTAGSANDGLRKSRGRFGNEVNKVLSEYNRPKSFKTVQPSQIRAHLGLNRGKLISSSSDDDLDDHIDYSALLTHLPLNLQDVKIVPMDNTNTNSDQHHNVIFRSNKITKNTISLNELITFNVQQCAFLVTKLLNFHHKPPLLHPPPQLNPYSSTWMMGVLKGWRYEEAEIVLPSVIYEYGIDYSGLSTVNKSNTKRNKFAYNPSLNKFSLDDLHMMLLLTLIELTSSNTIPTGIGFGILLNAFSHPKNTVNVSTPTTTTTSITRTNQSLLNESSDTLKLSSLQDILSTTQYTTILTKMTPFKSLFSPLADLFPSIGEFIDYSISKLTPPLVLPPIPTRWVHIQCSLMHTSCYYKKSDVLLDLGIKHIDKTHFQHLCIHCELRGSLKTVSPGLHIGTPWENQLDGVGFSPDNNQMEILGGGTNLINFTRLQTNDPIINQRDNTIVSNFNAIVDCHHCNRPLESFIINPLPKDILAHPDVDVSFHTPKTSTQHTQLSTLAHFDDETRSTSSTTSSTHDDNSFYLPKNDIQVQIFTTNKLIMAQNQQILRSFNSNTPNIMSSLNNNPYSAINRNLLGIGNNGDIFGHEFVDDNENEILNDFQHLDQQYQDFLGTGMSRDDDLDILTHLNRNSSVKSVYSSINPITSILKQQKQQKQQSKLERNYYGLHKHRDDSQHNDLLTPISSASREQITSMCLTDLVAYPSYPVILPSLKFNLPRAVLPDNGHPLENTNHVNQETSSTTTMTCRSSDLLVVLNTTNNFVESALVQPISTNSTTQDSSIIHEDLHASSLKNDSDTQNFDTLIPSFTEKHKETIILNDEKKDVNSYVISLDLQGLFDWRVQVENPFETLQTDILMNMNEAILTNNQNNDFLYHDLGLDQSLTNDQCDEGKKSINITNNTNDVILDHNGVIENDTILFQIISSSSFAFKSDVSPFTSLPATPVLHERVASNDNGDINQHKINLITPLATLRPQPGKVSIIPSTSLTGYLGFAHGMPQPTYSYFNGRNDIESKSSHSNSTPHHTNSIVHHKGQTVSFTNPLTDILNAQSLSKIDNHTNTLATTSTALTYDPSKSQSSIKTLSLTPSTFPSLCHQLLLQAPSVINLITQVIGSVYQVNTSTPWSRVASSNYTSKVTKLGTLGPLTPLTSKMSKKCGLLRDAQFPFNTNNTLTTHQVVYPCVPSLFIQNVQQLYSPNTLQTRNHSKSTTKPKFTSLINQRTDQHNKKDRRLSYSSFLSAITQYPTVLILPNIPYQHLFTFIQPSSRPAHIKSLALTYIADIDAKMMTTNHQRSSKTNIPMNQLLCATTPGREEMNSNLLDMSSIDTLVNRTHARTMNNNNNDVLLPPIMGSLLPNPPSNSTAIVPNTQYSSSRHQTSRCDEISTTRHYSASTPHNGQKSAKINVSHYNNQYDTSLNRNDDHNENPNQPSKFIMTNNFKFPRSIFNHLVGNPFILHTSLRRVYLCNESNSFFIPTIFITTSPSMSSSYSFTHHPTSLQSQLFNSSNTLMGVYHCDASFIAGGAILQCKYPRCSATLHPSCAAFLPFSYKTFISQSPQCLECSEHIRRGEDCVGKQTKSSNKKPHSTLRQPALPLMMIKTSRFGAHLHSYCSKHSKLQCSVAPESTMPPEALQRLLSLEEHQKFEAAHRKAIEDNHNAKLKASNSSKRKAYQAIEEDEKQDDCGDETETNESQQTMMGDFSISKSTTVSFNDKPDIKRSRRSGNFGDIYKDENDNNGLIIAENSSSISAIPQQHPFAMTMIEIKNSAVTHSRQKGNFLPTICPTNYLSADDRWNRAFIYRKWLDSTYSVDIKTLYKDTNHLETADLQHFYNPTGINMTNIVILDSATKLPFIPHMFSYPDIAKFTHYNSLLLNHSSQQRSQQQQKTIITIPPPIIIRISSTGLKPLELTCLQLMIMLLNSPNSDGLMDCSHHKHTFESLDEYYTPLINQNGQEAGWLEDNQEGDDDVDQGRSNRRGKSSTNVKNKSDKKQISKKTTLIDELNSILSESNMPYKVQRGQTGNIESDIKDIVDFSIISFVAELITFAKQHKTSSTLNVTNNNPIYSPPIIYQYCSSACCHCDILITSGFSYLAPTSKVTINEDLNLFLYLTDLIHISSVSDQFTNRLEQFRLQVDNLNTILPGMKNRLGNSLNGCNSAKDVFEELLSSCIDLTHTSLQTKLFQDLSSVLTSYSSGDFSGTGSSRMESFLGLKANQRDLTGQWSDHLGELFLNISSTNLYSTLKEQYSGNTRDLLDNLCRGSIIHLFPHTAEGAVVSAVNNSKKKRTPTTSSDQLSNLKSALVNNLNSVIDSKLIPYGAPSNLQRKSANSKNAIDNQKINSANPIFSFFSSFSGQSAPNHGLRTVKSMVTAAHQLKSYDDLMTMEEIGSVMNHSHQTLNKTSTKINSQSSMLSSLFEISRSCNHNFKFSDDANSHHELNQQKVQTTNNQQPKDQIITTAQDQPPHPQLAICFDYVIQCLRYGHLLSPYPFIATNTFSHNSTDYNWSQTSLRHWSTTIHKPSYENNITALISQLNSPYYVCGMNPNINENKMIIPKTLLPTILNPTTQFFSALSSINFQTIHHFITVVYNTELLISYMVHTLRQATTTSLKKTTTLILQSVQPSPYTISFPYHAVESFVAEFAQSLGYSNFANNPKGNTTTTRTTTISDNRYNSDVLEYLSTQPFLTSHFLRSNSTTYHSSIMTSHYNLMHLSHSFWILFNPIHPTPFTLPLTPSNSMTKGSDEKRSDGIGNGYTKPTVLSTIGHSRFVMGVMFFNLVQRYYNFTKLLNHTLSPHCIIRPLPNLSTNSTSTEHDTSRSFANTLTTSKSPPQLILSLFQQEPSSAEIFSKDDNGLKNQHQYYDRISLIVFLLSSPLLTSPLNKDLVGTSHHNSFTTLYNQPEPSALFNTPRLRFNATTLSSAQQQIKAETLYSHQFTFPLTRPIDYPPAIPLHSSSAIQEHTTPKTTIGSLKESIIWLTQSDNTRPVQATTSGILQALSLLGTAIIIDLTSTESTNQSKLWWRSAVQDHISSCQTCQQHYSINKNDSDDNTNGLKIQSMCTLTQLTLRLNLQLPPPSIILDVSDSQSAQTQLTLPFKPYDIDNQHDNTDDNPISYGLSMDFMTLYSVKYLSYITQNNSITTILNTICPIQAIQGDISTIDKNPSYDSIFINTNTIPYIPINTILTSLCAHTAFERYHSTTTDFQQKLFHNFLFHSPSPSSSSSSSSSPSFSSLSTLSTSRLNNSLKNSSKSFDNGAISHTDDDDGCDDEKRHGNGNGRGRKSGRSKYTSTDSKANILSSLDNSSKYSLDDYTNRHMKEYKTLQNEIKYDSDLIPYVNVLFFIDAMSAGTLPPIVHRP